MLWKSSNTSNQKNLTGTKKPENSKTAGHSNSWWSQLLHDLHQPSSKGAGWCKDLQLLSVQEDFFFFFIKTWSGKKMHVSMQSGGAEEDWLALRGTWSSVCRVWLHTVRNLQPPSRKLKLVEATANLQETVFFHHQEVMKLFCHTDQKCVKGQTKSLCSREETKNSNCRSIRRTTMWRHWNRRIFCKSTKEHWDLLWAYLFDWGKLSF